MRWRATFGAILSLMAASVANAGDTPAFTVRFDRSVCEEAVQGRLLLFFLREGANVSPRAQPADGPFYDDPQPLYGVHVANLPPGAEMSIGRTIKGFPTPLAELAAGRYRVQAVLDRVESDSDWSREPGNLYSETVTVNIGDDGPAETARLVLTRAVEQPRPLRVQAEVFEARSELLSEFRGRPVTMRAAVLPPRGAEPGRRYPAVYVVPGFGGNHRMINRYAIGREVEGDPTTDLFATAYLICLDPESSNGHTLFADSANNGPCGRALVEELIPALEAKYPLIAEASARIVTGHSSGGWSSVWLTTTYPDTFGFCFAGSPDPVDFHAFQKLNLYEQPNFYLDAGGQEIASNVQGGAVLMTIRQENLWEEARGPGNTSGQQWDSWQAVFGPRGEDGRPAALFDPITGVIDRRIAEQLRAYDITDRLSRDPDRFGPIFRDRVRIIVGGEDEWNLHEAVARLADRLRASGYTMDGKESFGKITIVPGADHGSVIGSDEYRGVGARMLDVLRGAGHTALKPLSR